MFKEFLVSKLMKKIRKHLKSFLRISKHSEKSGTKFVSGLHKRPYQVGFPQDFFPGCFQDFFSGICWNFLEFFEIFLKFSWNFLGFFLFFFLVRKDVWHCLFTFSCLFIFLVFVCKDKDPCLTWKRSVEILNTV